VPDSAGNVWVANTDGTVSQMLGLATPVVTPLVLASSLRRPREIDGSSRSISFGFITSDSASPHSREDGPAIIFVFSGFRCGRCLGPFRSPALARVLVSKLPQ
jgi:hypothetical protein